VVSHIARQHVTVALSGDGGDEMFGGYTRYVWGRRIWNQLRWLPGVVRRGLGSAIQQVPVPAWDALGDMAAGFSPVVKLGDKAHKLANRLNRVNDVDSLYRMLVTTWPPDTRVVPRARPLRTLLDDGPAWPTVPDPEQRMMMWDALTYLPDDILHKVDRASMAVSLETRAPFLDHRVAQLAWRLPQQMKIRDGIGKWIVRQVLYRHVPKELIERPKMGFAIPVDAWLRGPLREWAEDLMSESRLKSDGHLDAGLVRLKWAEHVSGRRNWQQELWGVLMFQAWLEQTR
jgi:asparagine synthase (glutamine-hydrolysing)